MFTQPLSRLILIVSLCTMALSVAAVDKVAFEYGNSAGAADVKRYGATATIDWGAKWLQTEHWFLSGYWEGGVNFWDSNPGTTGNDSLVDVSVTPVLRWQRVADNGFAPFLELGVGAHGFTETKIENKDFDIAFAFGSHIGGGIRLGDQGRYEFLYRFQHLSNASLGDRNPGINFHLFQFGYRF